MRYKLLALAAILLIATPVRVFAQKMSPIIIQTGDPTPSTVRTGESFVVTYRAKYTDAVLIIEERMRLDNLMLVADKNNEEKNENSVTASVEVLKLDIGEKFRSGSDEKGFENIQDFTYTFMIIDELKRDDYKIPSFSFVWVKKSAGVTTAQAKEREELNEFPTKEVGIKYVSSIPKSQQSEIRDATRFKKFKTLADKFLLWAYGIIFSVLFLVSWLLFNFFRQPKSKNQDGTDKADTSNEVAVEDEIDVIISPQQAKRDLVNGLESIERKITLEIDDFNENLKIIGELYCLGRRFVLSQFSRGNIKISDAQTPKDMLKYLAGLNSKTKKELGSKYDSSVRLIERLNNYYEVLESGSSSVDLSLEIKALKSILHNFNSRRERIFLFIRSWIMRRRLP